MKKWILGLVCVASAAAAVEPVIVHHGRMSDFIGGEADGIALHGDGHLTLAPRLLPWVDVDAERIWSMTSSGGRLYVGSGDDGKVHVIEDGHVRETFDVEEGAPLAVRSGAHGIYIGTGPKGQLLRQAGSNAMATLVSTSSQYVWDLAIDGDGLVLACGAEARVLRWSRDGRVDTLFHSPRDGHVRSLSRRANQWLIGTSASESTEEGKGHARVYELDGEGGSRLLLEAADEEIAALSVIGEDLFVAAMTVPTSGSPTVALLKLTSDGASYPIWRGSGIWAGLLRDGDELLAVTREPTRVLRFAADGQTGAILARTDSLSPNALAMLDGVLMLADSQSGRVWYMSSSSADKGHFDSSVYDAKGVAMWGALQWHGKGDVQVRTRSGNSSEHDDSWSDWSDPLRTPGAISSPSARYLQYRVELSQSDGSPRLERISFGLRQANLPPRIDDVVTFPYQGGPGVLQNPDQIPLPGQQKSNGSNGPRQRKSLRVLRWSASDPNGDPLRYQIYLRGEGQNDWKLIKQNVEHTKTLVWDTERLPEGLTQLRLVASDGGANPASRALEDSFETPPFTIDNTPPIVELQLSRQDGAWVLEAQLSDTVSRLQGARFSIDYDDDTTRLAAAGGLFDTDRESLRFGLPALAPGEHVISVQAWDELENLGVAQVVVEIEP